MVRVVTEAEAATHGPPRPAGETGEVVLITAAGLPRLEWSPAALRLLDEARGPVRGDVAHLAAEVAAALRMVALLTPPDRAGAILAVEPQIMAELVRLQQDAQTRRTAGSDDGLSRSADPHEPAL